jgi:hypothetical protein
MWHPMPSCRVVRIHQVIVVEIVTGRTHEIEYAAETFCGIIIYHQISSGSQSMR